MEKTLSMGAFTELDEREVMDVEGGGIWIPLVVVATAGIVYLAKNVGNMNQIVTTMDNLKEGETGSATCKDILGRPYEVTVTGGTDIGDYYSEAGKLFR